jgi:hypothetical protein
VVGLAVVGLVKVAALVQEPELPIRVITAELVEILALIVRVAVAVAVAVRV